jgi:hypothetical protein
MYCFLWDTNWIYICYVEESRPPLWSSGQSSWLQIQRSRFDSQRYQIFWEAVGLELGPLSLVSTIEELLGRNSSGSRLESREYDCKDMSLWPRGTLYPQKLALTSPTSGGRSVAIVRSRTHATEFLWPSSAPCVRYFCARAIGLAAYWAYAVPILKQEILFLSDCKRLSDWPLPNLI